MTNHLTPHWEHPATTWCAHCHKPLQITWSSSAAGHNIYHSQCWHDQENNENV